VAQDSADHWKQVAASASRQLDLMQSEMVERLEKQCGALAAEMARERASVGASVERASAAERRCGELRRECELACALCADAETRAAKSTAEAAAAVAVAALGAVAAAEAAAAIEISEEAARTARGESAEWRAALAEVRHQDVAAAVERGVEIGGGNRLAHLRLQLGLATSEVAMLLRERDAGRDQIAAADAHIEAAIVCERAAQREVHAAAQAVQREVHAAAQADVATRLSAARSEGSSEGRAEAKEAEIRRSTAEAATTEARQDIQRLKAQLATTEATLAAVSAGLHAGGDAGTRTAAGAGEVSGDGGRRRRQVLTERGKSPDAVVEELITDVDADVDASTLHPAEHGVLDGGSGNPDGADPTTALGVLGSQDSPNSPDTSDTPESLDSSDQDDAAVVMGETNGVGSGFQAQLAAAVRAAVDVVAAGARREAMVTQTALDHALVDLQESRRREETAAGGWALEADALAAAQASLRASESRCTALSARVDVVDISSRNFQTQVDNEVRSRTYQRERQQASKDAGVGSAWLAINASVRGATAADLDQARQAADANRLSREEALTALGEARTALGAAQAAEAAAGETAAVALKASQSSEARAAAAVAAVAEQAAAFQRQLDQERARVRRSWMGS